MPDDVLTLTTDCPLHPLTARKTATHFPLYNEMLFESFAEGILTEPLSIPISSSYNFV